MSKKKQCPVVGIRQTQPRVVKIVPVTGAVGDIKANSVTNQVYFIHNENQVGVLNGLTNQLIGYVQVGKGATFLAVNTRTNRIYTTNFRDNTVSVINGKTNRVITTVPVGVRPYGLGILKGSNRIYVANSNGTISIINGSTNRVVKTLRVGGAPSLLGTNERTKRIYVTNTASDSVHVINGQTQTVITTVKVGRNPIIAPGLNERTNRVYIGNNLSRYFSVINGSTNRKSIPIQIGHLQSELAVNPLTNRIYVTSAQVEGRGRLIILSGQSNKALKTLQVPTFSSLLVNPQTNHFFVGNTENRNLYVYSGRTNTRIALLRVGQSAGNMTLNARTNRLYIGNEGSITVVQDR
ncbi:YncE family protein [Paenibacillus sp. SI8]|uniref:YncE family protein n=1 Tax=unclassified Paenibacillus TaxID=185978 RepID=UPI00346558A7